MLIKRWLLTIEADPPLDDEIGRYVLWVRRLDLDPPRPPVRVENVDELIDILFAVSSQPLWRQTDGAARA